MTAFRIEPVTINLSGLGADDLGKIVAEALKRGDARSTVSPGNVTLQFPIESAQHLIEVLRFLNDLVDGRIRSTVLNAFDAPRA